MGRREVVISSVMEREGHIIGMSVVDDLSVEESPVRSFAFRFPWEGGGGGVKRFPFSLRRHTLAKAHHSRNPNKSKRMK